MTASRPDDYLTVEEACEYLGIRRAYLYRLVERHSIQRYKRPVNGRRVLFKRLDLDRLKEPRPVITSHFSQEKK